MGRGQIPAMMKLCEQKSFPVSVFQSSLLCIAGRGSGILVNSNKAVIFEGSFFTASPPPPPSSYLPNELGNFNEIFRKNVSYDNIKSKKTPGFYPL